MQPAQSAAAEAADWRWVFDPLRDIDTGDELAPWFALYLRVIKPDLQIVRQAPVDFGSFYLTE